MLQAAPYIPICPTAMRMMLSVLTPGIGGEHPSWL
jgi:hypothetical protein